MFAFKHSAGFSERPTCWRQTRQGARGPISLHNALIFNLPNVHELTPLETFGEKVIPAVAEF